jgi:hypothetical protein
LSIRHDHAPPLPSYTLAKTGSQLASAEIFNRCECCTPGITTAVFAAHRRILGQQTRIFPKSFAKFSSKPLAQEFEANALVPDCSGGRNPETIPEHRSTAGSVSTVAWIFRTELLRCSGLSFFNVGNGVPNMYQETRIWQL